MYSIGGMKESFCKIRIIQNMSSMDWIYFISIFLFELKRRGRWTGKPIQESEKREQKDKCRVRKPGFSMQLCHTLIHEKLCSLSESQFLSKNR